MLEQELVQAHTLCGWGLRVPQRAKPAQLVRDQSGRLTSWWSAGQIENASRQLGVPEEVMALLRQVRRRVPERHVWVDLPARLDPTTAAVYAAYLAEQGYEEAAGCMREVSALLSQRRRAELDLQRERDEQQTARAEEQRRAQERRAQAKAQRQNARREQEARRGRSAEDEPPDVILIDSDYYTADPGESQEDCDAALERLLERVKDEYPDATIICEPPHLWRTYLAMRPWGEVVRQLPDDWYEEVGSPSRRQ